MANTEKRWQLLLVADDGQIVPFKRVKESVIGAAVLVVCLLVLCMIFGWQFGAEKVRHSRTRSQLADVNQQLDDFKKENELINAELVLAEARMEKHGLAVVRRHKKKVAETASDTGGAAPAQKPADGPGNAAGTKSPSPAEGKEQTTATVAASADKEKAAQAAAPEKPSPVTLSHLDIRHDTNQRIVTARFRLANNNAPSPKLAGRCLVVLENENLEKKLWMTMPKVALADGTPDGKKGKSFRIARFTTMELMAPADRDPSLYDAARLYVFDRNGKTLFEQRFPVNLPAPKPVPKEKPKPAQAAKPSVEVDRLKVTHDVANEQVLAEFRIRNTGSTQLPVSGRCVVVLSDRKDNPSQWLALPQVKLDQGKPGGKRGQVFKIKRFRTMKVKTGGIIKPSAYTRAAVYVFDAKGALMKEKTFAVSLPAPPPAPEPVPAATQTKPEPDNAGAAPEAQAPVEPNSAAQTDATTPAATQPAAQEAPAQSQDVDSEKGTENQ